jgi:hypothetical protein
MGFNYIQLSPTHSILPPKFGLNTLFFAKHTKKKEKINICIYIMKIIHNIWWQTENYDKH